MRARLVLLLSLLVLLIAVSAAARADSQARRYAALSLIGDVLTVVTYQPQIGSRMDTNKRDRVRVAEGAFDRTSLAALDEAVTRLDPGASVVLLRASAPALFEDQRRFFSQGRFVMPPELEATLQQAQATHLLLLTKYRGEARVVVDDLRYGSGRLEGLGFYLDNGVNTRSSETGETGLGLVAPYAYFRVSLIDLKQMKVLASEVVARTEGVSGAHAKEGYGAWQALTEAQKVNLLAVMIERELQRVVPVVYQSAKN